MTLDLKSFLYHLAFDDEAMWNKNKEMLGYKEGEKYEDFFLRKHGYKHTEQGPFSRLNNVGLEDQLSMLKKENIDKTQKIKELTIHLKNMEQQLVKLVKGYKTVSSILLNI